MSEIKSSPRGLRPLDHDPRPTPYHEWDLASLSFRLSAGALERAKADRCAEADRERERRGHMPVLYAAAMFDADERAQRNVTAWQTQIAGGAVLPEGFVWRDAGNVDHAADAAFVNGLGAAITLRGTLLYRAAWAHKAAIDALADFDAVMAYDLTEGWTE